MQRLTDDTETLLGKALRKAREVNVPAGIDFLNEASRQLCGVHEHKCCDCGVNFDCIETDWALCCPACVNCRETAGLEG